MDLAEHAWQIVVLGVVAVFAIIIITAFYAELSDDLPEDSEARQTLDDIKEYSLFAILLIVGVPSIALIVWILGRINGQ